ncbi:MAG: glutamate--tRNA ligase, partial [Robiginitomaculum sp.]
LYARKHGGQFLLRIEDTDKKRSTPEATAAIIEGLDWLGLKADGDIVYQSQNAEDHVKAANDLIARGNGYRCYLNAEDQAALREISKTEGRAFRSPWRELGASDYPDGGDYVVRFKVPEGATQIDDAVQGSVSWQNSDFDDLILLRADGSPTYMLAVVVDDHNMGISHVIRGDDHLINAGRQSLIYQGLGWDVPEFAHVALIHGPDGKKLSKRHGALGADAYRDEGYIPDGLRNYLMKLGWASGDREIFTNEEAIEAFSLSGIVKSPARLDFEKMAYVNGQHIAMSGNDYILDAAMPFLRAENPDGFSDVALARVKASMDDLKPRSKTLIDIAKQAFYLTRHRPIPITGKAKKSVKGDAILRLSDLHILLEGVKDSQWLPEPLQARLTEYAESQSIGFGKVGQPLRAALTGGAPSPDLAVVLYRLGKQESLGRLTDCLETFK